MSHFFYIHKPVCGTPGVSKVGIAITPYSAVRLRQRVMAQRFSLDYVYFGRKHHIRKLEKGIKDQLSHKLLGGSAQTELFEIPTDIMRKFVHSYISSNNLDVKEVVLESPYSATNSGQCPLQLPSEKYVNNYLENMIKEQFGSEYDRLFDLLFEEV